MRFDITLRNVTKEDMKLITQIMEKLLKEQEDEKE